MNCATRELFFSIIVSFLFIIINKTDKQKHSHILRSTNKSEVDILALNYSFKLSSHFYS